MKHMQEITSVWTPANNLYCRRYFSSKAASQRSFVSDHQPTSLNNGLQHQNITSLHQLNIPLTLNADILQILGDQNLILGLYHDGHKPWRPQQWKRELKN